MNYRETKEFKKEFKKLSKKYKTLDDDLNIFKKVVNKFPLGNSKNFSILNKNENCSVVKARLFCKYLRKNSLRIIYAYFERREELEFIGIEFIELYFKGDKDRENKERINDYLKTRKN